jgi:hypothetical protein
MFDNLFVNVFDVCSRRNNGFVRNKGKKVLDELTDRVFTKIEHSVLHHKVHEGKELFKFSELVSFLRLFKDVEPTFANIVEAGLDDLFKSVDPT